MGTCGAESGGDGVTDLFYTYAVVRGQCNIIVPIGIVVMIFKNIVDVCLQCSLTLLQLADQLIVSIHEYVVLSFILSLLFTNCHPSTFSFPCRRRVHSEVIST